MKFIISSTALNNRLNTLSKVINSKNSLAILECILFSVENGKLTLTASDSENTMTSMIDLEESDANGSFCVPHRTITDAVKELPEQPLTFDIDMESLNIKVTYQNGVYHFTALHSAEYPLAQAVSSDATTLTMPAQLLNENITRTIFATAQDELRPVMNGIYFDLTPEALAIVASDGHKLVRNQIFSIKSETPAAFILPKKPAMLMKNVLPREAGDVTMRFDNRNAEFIFSEGMLSCRLIEGKYPNYNSVIPQANPNQMTIDRQVLLSALRRVTPFSNDASQLVRLHIEPGKLELSAEDIELATRAKEDVVCEYNGIPMNIGFKGSSLNEILVNLDSEEVVVELGDASRAGLILPLTQPENEHILMLIMPMLLND